MVYLALSFRGQTGWRCSNTAQSPVWPFGINGANDEFRENRDEPGDRSSPTTDVSLPRALGRQSSERADGSRVGFALAGAKSGAVPPGPPARAIP